MRSHKDKWAYGPRPCAVCGELYRRRRAREEEWPGTKPYGNGTECKGCARTRLLRNRRPVSAKMWEVVQETLGMEQGGR